VIPESTLDMTPPWFTSVLRPAIGDATVVCADLERVGAGVGLMGELNRAGLAYDRSVNDAPTSVIVKTTSPFEANRQQGIGLGMYEAEVRFYREIAPRLTVRTPRAFHAEFDATSGAFVVVLEDLGGLTAPDQIVGLTPAQVEAAVTALAELHATFWARTDEIGWVPSVVHDRIKDFSLSWPALWASFAGRFADALPEGAVAAGEAISDHYWSLMCALGERPWALIHQDFRCDNLFFTARSARTDVVVLDWQAIGRGPGAYDLAYLLAGSLTIDDRRAHEERLAREYLDRLHDRGVDYRFDDLWTDYRLCHLVNTSVPVITGGTMNLDNDRGRQLVATLG
jgi:aminoglycoside/choline kinase family phosphotransferase